MSSERPTGVSHPRPMIFSFICIFHAFHCTCPVEAVVIVVQELLEMHSVPRPEKFVPEFVAFMCLEGDSVQGSVVDFRRSEPP